MILKTTLPELLDVLFSMISAAKLRDLADDVLDKIEDLVKNTDTPYDDMIVLRLTRIIREAFHIPDNGGPIIVHPPTE
jgi:hypothetical protein